VHKDCVSIIGKLKNVRHTLGHVIDRGSGNVGQNYIVTTVTIDAGYALMATHNLNLFIDVSKELPTNNNRYA